jgi:hypothetical protein
VYLRSRDEKYKFIRLTEEKIPLWRPKYTCENNIKTDLEEMGCECVGCIQLPRDRN